MRNYSIDIRNKTIVLDFDYDKELVKKVKESSFTAHWNPELKRWIIPIERYSKENISKLIKENNFKFKPIVESKIEKFEYILSDETMEKLSKVCEKQNFTYTPRDYQLKSLHYGLSKQNFINGDDVGLGKTFEAIIYAEVTNSFPCLVITPASVKYNWLEKWQEIVGQKRTISVIESSPKKSSPNNWSADVVIINYDIIGKKQGKGATVKFDELSETKWKMFIFDEGHFLKDKTSQRSRVARMITKKSNGIIQLLTGTVIMSRPIELWNLLVLIKKDKTIANNYKQFILRYCGAYQTKYGMKIDGATNTLELNQLLRKSCYLRREKRDVLSELPDVEKCIIKLPITNAKDIVAAEADIIEYIRENKGDEKAESAMEAQSLVSLGVLRKLAIQGKLKALEQYLKDWKVGGKKLLIFGLHREELEYLSNKFDSKLIAGGVSSKNKQKIVKAWIDSDDVFLFANMHSAGTGIDGLQQVCSNMLITELPWRPSDLTQVIARVDRSGQTEPSTVRFMLSFDTIDKEMWEMLEEKEANTEAVNKGVDVIAEQSGMRIVLSKTLEKINNQK